MKKQQKAAQKKILLMLFLVTKHCLNLTSYQKFLSLISYFT